MTWEEKLLQKRICDRREVTEKGKYAMRSSAMEETTIEEDVQWMKRIAREIVDKKSVRITHDLGNKSSLYFGMIVPTDSCNSMYENMNENLSANRIDSIDYGM